MKIDIEFLERFVDNIAELIGDSCEIVIHDFTNGLDKTIEKIANGHVTGRTVGGCPTNLFYRMYKDTDNCKNDIPMYFNNTEDGRLFKSSTTFIKNCMCCLY